MHEGSFIDGARISVYQRVQSRMQREWAAGVVVLPHYSNKI